MEKYQWFESRGPLLVTVEGETIQSSGVITGGIVGESGGILRRRGEIIRLEAKAKELKANIEESQSSRDAVTSDVESTQAQLQELQKSIRETEVRLMSLQQEEGLRVNAIPELTRRLETIRNEQLTEEAEVAQLQEESIKLREQLVQLESVHIERTRELEQASQRFTDIENQVNDVQSSITETRMSLSTFQAKRTHEQSDLARLHQEEEVRAGRVQELDRQLEQLFLQTRQSRDERLRQEELFERAEEKKDAIQKTLTEFQDQYNQILEASRSFDRQIAEIRERISETLKVRNGITLRLAEVRTKLTTVEETLTETYGLSLESLQEVFTHEHDSGEEQPEASSVSENSELWKEQLQTIRGKLGRMGPINLAAIEEHQELQGRFEFLTTQEADLTASIQSLQEIIQRLNRTTSKLFAETFKSIQEKFNEVFTALFAGGRAELVLVEPEEEEEGESNPREAGVDIVAQPPGKRLKNLSMLSGGEKTLTVLALLFASFLIKPSPFCVLDEVDAPLDEANVARFGQFLTQMAERSQFIIVTHNKRTMEVADSLFGVTMEEPGVSKLVSVRLSELQEAS